jgi:hypothetical protein
VTFRLSSLYVCEALRKFANIDILEFERIAMALKLNLFNWEDWALAVAIVFKNYIVNNESAVEVNCNLIVNHLDIEAVPIANELVSNCEGLRGVDLIVVETT